jgi:hypothetical protein
MIPPETIDDTFTCTADVVRELERLRRPRMAAWVKDLGGASQRFNQREYRLLDRINELEAKYEPTVRVQPYDPTPPPEASD